MKPTAILFSIALIILLYSCSQPASNKTSTPGKNDSAQTAMQEKERQRREEQRLANEKNKIDSIRLDSILQAAISDAEQAKTNGKFSRKYTTMMPDSAFNVDVDIHSDFFFTKEYPHLIIKRSTPIDNYINIYIKTDKGFSQVFSYKQWAMEYTGDTIRDINGDNLKDVVINWYGTTGCCLKSFSIVYLQRPGKTSFSEGFEFINPTFSPKERIVRGVEYGHPGETSMYKYRWNREAVDTVEYVYYEKNDKDQKTGKVILAKWVANSDNAKILKRLNSAPSEYKKIYGYDWFTGKY